MSREIRKENDWWGDEKEVIYEDGHEVGEVRTEETWGGLGPTVQRTYNTDGERISETRREETWGGLGPTVERTYDTGGERISETRQEETWGGLGPTVNRTYDTGGERISETRREETWGGFGPTVKRENDTDRGTRPTSNHPYNEFSKYATYAASPSPVLAEPGASGDYGNGTEVSNTSASLVRGKLQRADRHISEHRKYHRQHHVRDHR